MTASDPRVGEIQAEAVEAAGKAMAVMEYERTFKRTVNEPDRLWSEDGMDAETLEDYRRLAHAALEAAAPHMRAYLLAELRDRDEKLARVLEACDRIINNEDGHKPPGPPHPTREQATACRIRAAVAAAGGGGQ